MVMYTIEGKGHPKVTLRHTALQLLDLLVFLAGKRDYCLLTNPQIGAYLGRNNVCISRHLQTLHKEGIIYLETEDVPRRVIYIRRPEVLENWIGRSWSRPRAA